MDKAALLRSSLLFAGLDDDEASALCRITHQKRFNDGEYIFWEGDEPRGFYIVVEGMVKVLKHTFSGREFIIAFFDRGEVFGEVAVLEAKPYPASARAVGEAVVLEIGRDEFLGFLSGQPEVALRIIRVLSGRLREAQSRLKDFAGMTVEQRIARILLMLHKRLGKELPFSRQDIAGMAATTVESAIRAVGRMREEGLLDSARNRIIIKDVAGLASLAEGAE